MTKEIKEMFRFAKEGLKENGYNVAMKNMVALESGSHVEEFLGDKITIYDYAMIEDKKSGKEYQIYWGANHYNPEKNTLYSVRIYE